MTLARLKTEDPSATPRPVPPAAGESGARESARQAWEAANQKALETAAALKQLDGNAARPGGAEPPPPAAPDDALAVGVGGPELAVSLVGIAMIIGVLYLLVRLLRGKGRNQAR